MEYIPGLQPEDYPTRAEADADRRGEPSGISHDEWLARYHAIREGERDHLRANGWERRGTLWLGSVTGEPLRLHDALVEQATRDRSEAAA